MTAPQQFDKPPLVMSEKLFIEGSGSDSHAVELDWNSPDKILARSEPMHPDDGDDIHEDYLHPDDGLTIDAQGIHAIPRDALRVLLLFLLPPGHNRRRWRIGQLRLIVLAHMVGIESVSDYSLAQIADQIGCTRAILSLHQLRIVDSLRLDKARQGKSRRSREVYRRSATDAHRRLGHQMGVSKQPELQTL